MTLSSGEICRILFSSGLKCAIRKGWNGILDLERVSTCLVARPEWRAGSGTSLSRRHRADSVSALSGRLRDARLLQGSAV